MKTLILILLAGATVLATGCSSIGVKPWDRDLLSKKEMQFGVDSVDEGYTQHIYFSKEASSGGSGFSGGGCGCN